MLAVFTREMKNYLKRPLFWLGIAIVICGVYSCVSPYLTIHYLAPGETIVNDYPETFRSAEVYEGYVPSTAEEQRKLFEQNTAALFIETWNMTAEEANAVIEEMKDMDISQACDFLETQYRYVGAINAYRSTAFRKGTPDEINAYLAQMLSENPFSYYFSRKFADFAGLFMGFFATVMLSVLFLQDTRRHTYELLHTKPIRAGSYVAGKALGGFSVCLIALVILTLTFWALCIFYTRDSGFTVRLTDFITASCLYILPNMLWIVCVYLLISLLFKNPLPAVPLLLLLMVYSNIGSRNAEGIYGYYGHPFAIMVRFLGSFFDTAPPPMALLNQSLLLAASAVILLLAASLWKRRRM